MSTLLNESHDLALNLFAIVEPTQLRFELFLLIELPNLSENL